MLVFQPQNELLSTTLEMPGDKSISHRALILGSLAEGTTKIEGLLLGEDCLATLNILKSLGVNIQLENSTCIIQGKGKYHLSPPLSALNCENSGTSMRVFMGLLAAQAFSSTLIGDASLSRRPMKAAQQALYLMGANIALTEDRYPPVQVFPVTKLNPIDYFIENSSAQIKTSLLMAGLYASPGLMQIRTPAICRDHTERMLLQAGAELDFDNHKIIMKTGQNLQGFDIQIPGDFSSAAFFIVAACIAKNSELTLKNIGLNPTRIALLKILKQMGAQIEINLDIADPFKEPQGDLYCKSSKLHGIVVDPQYIINAIDELPILMIAAACAEGCTEIRGAAALRTKESDRIHAMATGLTTLGIRVEEFPDGIKIYGGKMLGGSIHSFGDHRIAMSFAIASIAATQPITIFPWKVVATSFPGFVDLLKKIGVFGIQQFESSD